MPLIESSCQSPGCAAHGKPIEHFLWHWDSPLPVCESCGGPTKREMSTFAVVFTGALTARYNDKRLENSHQDGHVAWERDATGKPHPVHIETFDQQRDFCKRNHLMNPKDAPTNCEVSEDGRTVLNTRGLPGSYI